MRYFHNIYILLECLKVLSIYSIVLNLSIVDFPFFLPLRQKKINKSASIVFVASIASWSPSFGNSIYSSKNGRHKLTAYEKEFMDCVCENPVYSGGFADAVCNAIKEIYTANFAVENTSFLKP